MISSLKEHIASLFRLQALPSLVILALVFLAPLFFIPSVFISLQLSKMVLVATFTVVAFCIFIVSILKKGRFEIPVNKMSIAALSILIVAAISTLVSTTPLTSFFGYGFETDTLGSLLILFTILFLSLSLFQSERTSFYGYIVFFVSTAFVLLIHIARVIFGPSVFSFGVLPNITTNTVGKLYDLGILCGVAFFLSIISIEMLISSKALKWFFYIIAIVSLGVLIVLNFSLLWIVLIVFSVLFFAYVFSFEKISNTDRTIGEGGEVVHIAPQSGTRKVSFIALAAFIVSIFFFLPIGSNFGNALATKAGISSLEVRPSWGATLSIAKNTFKERALFGAGPARFASQWQLFKLKDINSTFFWNTPFARGVGYIPTFVVTTGIIGILSWLSFFVLFVYIGVKALITKKDNQGFSRYLLTSSFFIAAFLWVMAFVYNPDLPILVLTFFFTGLFFAALRKENMFRLREISFFSYPKASFAFVISLVLVILLSLVFGYMFISKTVSAYYLQRGIASFTRDGNIPQSEAFLIKSLDIAPSDVHYREIAALYMAKLNAIVASVGNNTEISDETRQSFQQTLANAVEGGRLATVKDPDNYENWLVLGTVYRTAAALGVEQAYESAKSTYEIAMHKDPNNPRVYLMLAYLEGIHKDFEKALASINQALALRENYSDAIFLRSQIEVAQGNLKGAIASVEKIVSISPDDYSAFFDLGLLKYNDKDYAGAAAAFERVVASVANYSNARYFLGLSYEKLGRVKDAIAQFEEVAALNPENREVTLILQNLRAGRDPFADAKPPIDDTPEKRSQLPIDER